MAHAAEGGTHGGGNIILGPVMGTAVESFNADTIHKNAAEVVGDPIMTTIALGTVGGSVLLVPRMLAENGKSSGGPKKSGGGAPTHP
jgi:hypothetical protein